MRGISTKHRWPGTDDNESIPSMLLAHQLWQPTPPESARDAFVLLHGMGGTGRLWRPIAAGLETHARVLAPDQRGHGGSQLPHRPAGREAPAYTPLDYGKDVVETLDSLHFPKAWVIGHSMGVRTAVATAYLAPDRVKGLILVDLGFEGPAGGGLGDTLGNFLRVLPIHFPTREAAREFVRANCPDPAIAQYLMAVSVPDPAVPGGITFPFDQAALIATIQAAKDVSIREWLKPLGERGMPVLSLRGETSTVWSLEDFEHEKTLFQSVPSFEFEEFPGTGHGLPFEKRREFLERVERFVHEHATAGPPPGKD